MKSQNINHNCFKFSTNSDCGLLGPPNKPLPKISITLHRDED